MDPSLKLSIINPEPVRIPGPCLLHHLVTPPGEATALAHLEPASRTTYSYADLHRAADAVANRLAALERDQNGQFVVPVLIQQSPALYISFLGILKAGGAFCPLNIDAPPDRVRFILHDVSAKAVLVSRELASRIPHDYSARVIVADDEGQFGDPDGAISNNGHVGSEDLAYVMYTSGSTGTPKGVGISHGAVTQSLLAHDRHLPAFERFLQFAAPTFDVSVFEIFFPLFRGSTLVSARRSELLNDLPAVLRDMDVDACELTPTVAGSLLRTRDQAPCLRLLLTIGEMLTEPVVREFGGNDERDSMLWGMYGPTEATIHCTLQPSMPAISTVRNIGFPLDTVSCFVARPASEEAVDSTFEVLPQGEIGELVVGGHQLAAGYLNRPEQTAAAFISTPYGRLYRTGDKAHVLPDGTLECLGRLSDGQVKLRGQRIELGEVQQAILRTPGCHGAAVVVHDNLLVAFCSTQSEVLEDAILQECKRWLPGYMLPNEIILMPSLPKLPSGKTDKRTLLADFIRLKQDSTRSTLSSGEREELPEEFLSVLSGVLGRPVDDRTSFSATGIDSLSAIRISSSLRSAGFDASVGSVIRAKSAADLWVHLRETLSPPSSAPSSAKDVSLMEEWAGILSEFPHLNNLTHLVEDVVPCTSIQSAMLLETLQTPGLYWNEVELEANADAHAMGVALERVIEANEVLRTGFVPWRGSFVSVVLKTPAAGLIQVVDQFQPLANSHHLDELLRTIRVQIKSSESGERLSVMIHIHHAVYDGWSMDMLRADLSSILQGTSPPRRPQFRNVVEFLHQPIQHEIESNAKAFWAEHLLGWTKDPFPQLLCSDSEIPDLSTADGFLRIDPLDLEAASKQLGCSMQVWFQASLAIVWSGILGSTDVVIGTVTSGRTIPVPGIDRIMGPCIMAQPLRFNLGTMTEVSHLLNHIQASNTAMLEIEPLPLGEIRKLTHLQPGDALYDVLFVYQQSPDSGSGVEKVVAERRHQDQLETRLLFEIEPRGDGFTVRVTARPKTADKAAIGCLIEQFMDVFTQIMRNSRQSLSSLYESLSVPKSIFNVLPSPFEGTPDLAWMVEQTVATSAQNPAICFARPGSTEGFSFDTITYAELNKLSNRIAHGLSSKGMVEQQVIGLAMEKSIMLYASMLAIAKAGCAYLPILPSTPVQRARTIFEQANVRHCLVDRTAFENFQTIESVSLADVQDIPLSELPDTNPRMRVDGSRLAYVIYTSGTTGTPKGVAVTQLNIASNINYLASVYPPCSHSEPRLLQSCSQAFDVSVFEIFYTWHKGMCLCSGTNDTIFEDLERTIREFQITHLSLTPTVASLVRPENVPSVEFLVTAGEPMTHSVLEKWGDLLWQGYGPSETTNICTVKKMNRNMPIEHLGWSFPNTSVVVQHPNGAGPVPVGWVGEFWFGGDQVASGYLNQDALTAAHFLEHPHFGRIYRSGDMGRMLPDGSLVILGRLDDQVKLRGQRIEPQEVDSLITSIGLASSAVTVVLKRTAKSTSQLVSFYMPSVNIGGDGVLDVDVASARLLFSHLHSRLPSYMVPSYVIPLARIPLTSSGKCDRKTLQDWFETLPQLYLDSAASLGQDNDNGAEWSETERHVADAIIGHLGISRSDINRWTPFTAFGIDSITSIGLARLLGKTFGRRVAVSTIIRNPTVAQLARALDSQVEHLASHESLALVFSESFVSSVIRDFSRLSKSVQSILPCTPLQEAMLSGSEKHYCNKVILRLKVSEERMQAYWKEMVQRHEILRTCFVTTLDPSHAVAQVVLSEYSLPWHVFDVRTPSFDEVVEEHVRTLPSPVDSNTPPFSLGVIRYRDSTFLSFICHHALYDGMAMSNLWQEIEALANDLPLPTPVAYRDFLGEMMAVPPDAEKFWKSQMQGFQPSQLFPASSLRNFHQAVHSKTLRLPLAELQERLRVRGLSLLSLFQAAWANTAAIAYESHDVCFGNVVSGRGVDVEGVERLVAPCFNTIPLRADMSTVSHGNALVKYFLQLNSETLKYQFTPLRLAQKVVDRQGQGLFETLLLMQQPLRDMDNRVWILESDSGDMDLPLVCEVTPCPSLNSIVVNMHYDMNVIDPSMTTAVTDLFELIVDSIVEKPFESLVTRDALPSGLQDDLKDLRPKRPRSRASLEGMKQDETWSEAEAKIRQALVQLSGLPDSRVSRDTTIFQLGLDSINAVQIASILRRQGWTVSASDVIEYPSCSKLADVLLARDKNGEHPALSVYDFGKFAQDVAQSVRASASERTIEAILPCTPIQCAMMTSFIQSGGQDYLNTLVYTFPSSITGADVSRAWGYLHRQHPMLRTALVPVSHGDSTFAMLRYPHDTIGTPIVDLSADDEDSGDIDGLERQLREEISIRGDMPPWRVALYRENSRLMMRLIIHHALYDAHSLEMLLGCFSQALLSKATNKIPMIEPGLARILSGAQAKNTDAERFWRGREKHTLVNKFPIMTPLRETNARMGVETIRSSAPFSTLQSNTKESGFSVQAVIQSTWTRLLASYLGEPSVVFGMTFSGRTDEHTADAPLPCVVTLPIVASDVASNTDLVQSMMELNAQIHKYPFVPLSQVQKWLGHPASPVFDTIVSYRKTTREEASPRPFQFVNETVMIDYPVSMEIEASDADDTVHLTLTHRVDVLPQEQAALLLQQFDAVMQDLSSSSVGEGHAPLLKNPRILSHLPPEMPEMPAPVQFLHQFVELRARSHPNSIALEFADSPDAMHSPRRWTYKEFNEMGNRVAHLLSPLAAPGSIVAIHFDKCPEAYFGILGILKAGCSFVALDPGAPAARKDFILSDSKSPCLLVSAGHVLDFGNTTSTKTVELSDHTLQKYPSTPLELGAGSSISPESTCYCLYTSGTTGTPKGCEITHKNAVQAMMAFQELFSGHWDPESRWLQFAAFHFDVSVLEQYWSWSVGIAVVSVPKDVILDDLTGTISKLGITHIDLTPSLARLTHPDDVPSLCKGVFITGGESLKQEILDVWGPKAVIYNAYGPTEATIGVTMYQRVPVNGRPSNIGKQFLNVGSYVFQPGTETPVLRGGVGELCVSGKLVGKGYLNRPELTRDRFPVLKSNGERIYRTGDLVRLLHDGCFDFLGRADDQVKLRGQRLEIGEINHAIRSVPDVSDTATIVVSHGSPDKSVLVSFLVSRRGAESNHLQVLPDLDGLGAEAREACRSRLPGYMVPTYFLGVSYIPLSSNNKVEAKELKRIFTQLSHDQLMEFTASSAPASGVDTLILAKTIDTLSAFSGLDTGSISASASIFELGVDSISALRLSSLFRDRGIVEATPSKILRNPNVQDLARALSKGTADSQSKLINESQQVFRALGHRQLSLACRELNVTSADIEYVAPCTPLQEGIIAKSLIQGTSGAYFNSFELVLSPGVQEADLHAAWDSLISSEAILRTSLLATSTGFVQVALRSRSGIWRSLSVSSETERSHQLASVHNGWLKSNSQHIKEPLQLIYVRTPSSNRLHVNIFHAIYDGTSFGLILSRLASSLTHSETIRGPPFLEAAALGPLRNLDDSRNFWMDHLSGWRPSPVQLQSGYLPKAASYAATKRTLDGTKIEQVQKSQNATLQAVLLALWVSALQAYHPGGLTLGLIVAGRSIDLPGVEHTIGPLFNTLPFFNKTLRGHTWASLIHKCQRFGTDVLPFQHAPLAKIQKWCSNGQPLFNTLFTLQVENDTSGAQSKLWEVVDGAPDPDYPLALEITRTSGGSFEVFLLAQGHIGSEAALEKLIYQVEEHLDAMASREGQLITTDDGLNGAPEFPAAADQQPDETFAEGHGSFQWSEAEAIIRSEVATLSGVDARDIGPSTTVLEVGLDSIDLIKLSARLRAQDFDIAASKIMRLQTIPNIAGAAEQAVRGQEQGDTSLSVLKAKLWQSLKTSGFDMATVETVLPATPLQESMVAAMVESGFDLYFNHDIMEVGDGVDMERLVAAWNKTAEALPILRTGFVEVDDAGIDSTYCQVVYRSSEGMWKDAIQGTSLDDANTLLKAAVDLASQHEAQKNLFQLSTISLGPRTYLVLSMAHALYDGWSLGLTFRELFKAYHGETPSTSPVENIFNSISRVPKTEIEEFWADYLREATPTLLPELITNGNGDATVYRHERSSDMAMDRVRSFCKKHSTSLQVLLQSCWASVLARRTGRLDVTFGVVMSGRDFEGAEDLVFPTMNTVAVRSILHGSSSSFLQYAEEGMGGVRSYQIAPLRRVQMFAGCSIPGGLFNSLFLLQSSVANSDPEELLKSVKGESAVDYPVCVEAEVVGDKLVWRAACYSRFVSEAGVEGLLESLDQVLQFYLDSPDTNILSFSGSNVTICGRPSMQLGSGEESEHNHVNGWDDGEKPWTQSAVTIREVLSQVSGIPESDIRLSDTLYHLGLDSISAIKVSSLLRRRAISLTPRALISATSIGSLADLADQEPSHPAPTKGTAQMWEPPASMDLNALMATHGLSSESVDAVLPALPMQVYMLSAWENSQGSVFYPTFFYLLSHRCSREEIDNAWQSVVKSTPMLRTVFVGTGRQDVPVLQVTLKSAREVNPESPRILCHLQSEWDEQREAWVLKLGIHHALYDGVSLPAIMQALSSAIVRGSIVTSGEADQMTKWEEYTAHISQEDARSVRRQFWAEYLNGCPRTLGSEQSRTDHSVERISYVKRSAVPDTSRLRRSAAQLGLGIQSLFLAAYAKVLAGRRVADQGLAAESAKDLPPTVVFGIYLANRGGPDSDGLPSTYPTLNLVLLRVDVGVDGRRGLADVAAEVHRDLGTISQHGRCHVGLWEIDEWTGVKISSFVNFLSLPDSDDGEDNDETPVLREMQGPPPTQEGSSRLAKTAGDLAIKDSFPPSLDIEASLRGSGMDVGVFGPSSLVADEDAAAALTAEIVGILEAV